MCGIFGFATGERGKNASSRRDTFINGLIFNMPRGWDSTGIAHVKEIGTPKKHESYVGYYKRALHVIDYLETKQVKKLLGNTDDYHYLIGHCRSATRGTQEDNNAHPFQYDHITLVHNGTVDQGLLAQHKATEFVDSASICSHMAKAGELETLEKLDGAFALVWYNQNDDTLNFARNKRKPMAWGFVKDENTMYYSSEWGVLNAAMIRNDQQIDGKILIPKPFMWYKVQAEDVREYTITEFKEYVRPMYAGPQGQWGPGGPRHNHHPQRNRQQVMVHPATSTTTPGNTTPSKPDAEPTTRESTETPSSQINDLKGLHGVPSSAARLKWVANYLQKFGLSIGGITIMVPKKFVPYKNQLDRGQIVGERITTKAKLVMYSVSSAQFALYHNTGKIAVRCVNIELNHENNGPAIVVVVDEMWNSRFMQGLSKSGEGTGHGDDTQTVPPKAAEEGKEEVVHYEAEGRDGPNYDGDDKRYMGPGGSWITRPSWERLVATGCGGCSGIVSREFHSKVLWIGDSPVCHECAGQPSTLEALGLEDNMQRALLH